MNEVRTLEVERSTSTAHRLTHYNGACGNVHGHNMKWEAEVTVNVEDMAPDNMPVDLKEISDTIDEVDHAIVLNENDALLHALDDPGQVLGEYWVFEGDPTCEVMARSMARGIYNISEAVDHVRVSVAETDKYSISAKYGEYDALQEDD